MENEPISFSFMTEKKPGFGEDADPIRLILTIEKAYAVGVFDGMGGAGSAICDSSYGEHSKAYVASRTVQSSLMEYLNNHLPTNDVSEEDMKTVIENGLSKEKKSHPPKVETALRSKLVRDYPTTMAMVVLHVQDEKYQVDSYWAGDSRCYLWTKDKFFQISKDDLEESNDPMENLNNDSPLSNCVCLDRDFTIRHKCIPLEGKEPVVILSATDGCFGYYPTPMHFEYVLKNCLIDAKDATDWGDKVKECITKVAGDDTSLSLIALGFASFDDLKQNFSEISDTINKMIDAQKAMEGAREELNRSSCVYEQSKKDSWEIYKRDYMKYISDVNNGTT